MPLPGSGSLAAVHFLPFQDSASGPPLPASAAELTPTPTQFFADVHDTANSRWPAPVAAIGDAVPGVTAADAATAVEPTTAASASSTGASIERKQIPPDQRSHQADACDGRLVATADREPVGIARMLGIGRRARAAGAVHPR